MIDFGLTDLSHSPDDRKGDGMPIVFKCNTREELRTEIVNYLTFVEEEQRQLALDVCSTKERDERIARANLTLSLAMNIRSAILLPEIGNKYDK